MAHGSSCGLSLHRQVVQWQALPAGLQKHVNQTSAGAHWRHAMSTYRRVHALLRASLPPPSTSPHLPLPTFYHPLTPLRARPMPLSSKAEPPPTGHNHLTFALATMRAEQRVGAGGAATTGTSSRLAIPLRTPAVHLLKPATPSPVLLARVGVRAFSTWVYWSGACWCCSC